MFPSLRQGNGVSVSPSSVTASYYKIVSIIFLALLNTTEIMGISNNQRLNIHASNDEVLQPPSFTPGGGSLNGDLLPGTNPFLPGLGARQTIRPGDSASVQLQPLRRGGLQGSTRCGEDHSDRGEENKQLHERLPSSLIGYRIVQLAKSGFLVCGVKSARFRLRTISSVQKVNYFRTGLFKIGL
ncbi:hypothetical protein RRG08_041745 [Elysia crispata]|uniref:Uncharacterized protein n=1 Tax=Elysia crispata TaxID=231223 RepID=A0AAE0Z0D5_9GAST|nr:hypothetical protein RRG08_041745 [Elysia crispata]